jgi:hypothetical protein
VLRLRVPAMDCGAEEAEIRRALEPLAASVPCASTWDAAS